MTGDKAETRIIAITLPCAQPLATAEFYRRAFGCRTSGTPHSLLLGEQRLVFSQASSPSPEAPPLNATAFQHCAIVVSDMIDAMAQLETAPGWAPISCSGPERLPDASGGVTAFKFRDPEGHPLELLQFPSGRVPEPWRQDAAGPFLGIDHSAITVSDTDASIAFWQRLGFRVSDRHWNRGPEQARMDGLDMPDTVVEVTTLRPTGGAPPHLELLCYHATQIAAARVPDGSVYAAALHLQHAPGEPGPLTDPDGHRLLRG